MGNIARLQGGRCWGMQQAADDSEKVTGRRPAGHGGPAPTIRRNAGPLDGASRILRAVPSSIDEESAGERDSISTAVRTDALLLDANTRQVLVTARSLGRAGRTVALAESWGEGDALFRIPAFASRWSVANATLPSFRDDSDIYAAAVLELIKRRPTTVVIPAMDGAIAALRPWRSHIERQAGLALASDAALDVANDKDRTLELADELRIGTPRSARIDRASDIPSALREVGLPAVIKPTQSWLRRNGTGWRVVPCEVVNEAEARAAYEKLEMAGCPAIAQQWISGRREAVSILYARGRMWAEFAQVAHRMSPVLGGYSVIRESIPVPPELHHSAVGLVEALDLEGYSEIEYRRDTSGRPMLMEINARLSGSVEIAVRAGVDFPGLLWGWAAGESLAVSPGYRTGVRMRYLYGDVQWLLENLRRRGRPDSVAPVRAVGMFAGEFFRRDGYDYVDRHDLRPALVATGRGLVGAGRRVSRKLRSVRGDGDSRATGNGGRF